MFVLNGFDKKKLTEIWHAHRLAVTTTATKNTQVGLNAISLVIE